MLLTGSAEVTAQVVEETETDSTFALTPIDSLLKEEVNTIQQTATVMTLDTAAIAKTVKAVRDWSKWQPKPQRALWLAMVIPGAGQIYNRKFWKLPIIYGGFMGCIYAMSWNNQMYKDYSQAFLDIMDDDPGTQSYNQFLHLGRQITSENIDHYTKIFKNRRDKYRRWRDLSFFVMVGVYALSVIDAYVDADLSVFDISKDLSLKVEPTLMTNPMGGNNPLKTSSLGLNCSIHF
jgi:hypothetical protein